MTTLYLYLIHMLWVPTWNNKTR